LVFDGMPLLPSEETVDNTDDQQSFLDSQGGEPRFILGAGLFSGCFFLIGYGVKRLNDGGLKGRLIVLIAIIGTYSGGCLMFFGTWY
jgi:hypothetical protein